MCLLVAYLFPAYSGCVLRLKLTVCLLLLSFLGIEEQAPVVDDEIQPLLDLYVHFEQLHPRSSNAIRPYFSVSVHVAKSWTKCTVQAVSNLQVSYSLTLSPGLLMGEGERPDIHCLRMRYIFRIIYHKVSICTLIPTTCWQVKRSMCLKNTGWPPDLCTSDHAKCVPTLLRGLHRSMDVAQTISKSRSKLKLSKPAISRYVEHNELRSKGKYTRQYPYVIGLFKIWIITVHAHTVDTKPFLPLPPQKAWGRG